jgi:hypothetical protein
MGTIINSNTIEYNLDITRPSYDSGSSCLAVIHGELIRLADDSAGDGLVHE